MAVCWHCYWGWPRPVADIYIEAVKRLDGYEGPLEYGPSHIVWADENFDWAQRCLDNLEKNSGDYSKEQIEVVKWSLESLLELPDDQVNVEPEDYDLENPKDYPPPEGVEMTKDMWSI